MRRTWGSACSWSWPRWPCSHERWGHEFVNYDDNEYVYENRHVRNGLTWEGAVWALTHVHSANWHPLTTLSHELDCSLYGLWAGGHHLTNVLLHAAASVTLFLALRRLTGAVWRSGIVAAFFCLHPLHVESVAWVSERKDVLSGLFFGLTLWAYAGYARSRERGAGVACLSTPGYPVLRVGAQACCGSEVRGAEKEGGHGDAETRGGGGGMPKHTGAPGTPGRCAGMWWERGTWWQYAMVVGFFALGLLCKPMLVTMPFVLLLLDYWPLGRLGAGGKDAERGRRGDAENLASPRLPVSPSPHLRFPPPSPLPAPVSLLPDHDHEYMVPDMVPARPPTMSTWCPPALLEKLPLLALSAASCAITYWVQSSSRAVSDLEPWGMRLQTALTAYAGYLIKMVWPFGLAVAYPRVREPESPAAVACGLALTAVAAAVILLARRGHRYLAVGWFWYLGMLAPVIGLIAIGEQAMADRYTYLPLVGIFLAVVWGGAELMCCPWSSTIEAQSASEAAQDQTSLALRASMVPPLPHVFGLATAAVLLVLCAVRTFDQLRYWSDSESLFRHAIAVTHGNSLAHTNLGVALRGKGRHDEEIAEYRAALRIQPHDYLSNANLGFALSERGKVTEAMEHYRAALRSKPNDPLTLHNLGLAMATLGRTREAEGLFRESLRLDPASPLAEENRKTLAFAWLKEGRLPEAIGEFREMLREDPNESVALNSLAWLLATHPDKAVRNGPEAVALAQRAVAQQKEDQPVLLDTLAAAYAEAGRYQEAVETAEKAQAVAVRWGNKKLSSEIQERLKLYRAGKPYREEAAKP